MYLQYLSHFQHLLNQIQAQVFFLSVTSRDFGNCVDTIPLIIDEKKKNKQCYMNPFSFREMNGWSPMMTWSSSSMPMMLPASTRRFVTSMSAGDGAGVPAGWLWAQTIEAEERRTASRKISRGWTMEAFRLPTKMVWRCMTWFLILRNKTTKCSCFKEVMSASK